MKILFLSNYYPPFEVGGYEQLCRDVAERLRERGHQIAVLTGDAGRGQAPDTPYPVYRHLTIQPRQGTRLGPAAQFLLSRRRLEAANRHTLRAAVAAFRPDLIFVWNLQGLPHELALDAEADPTTAVAYWLAGFSPAEPDAFWRYWARQPGRRALLAPLKRGLRALALARLRREGKPARPALRHVGVVSQYMLDSGMAAGTIPEEAEIIPNGVEIDLFYRPVPPSDTPPPLRLLLAGRVSEDKGVHDAIDALGHLAQIGRRDVTLDIAGHGPPAYVDRLRRQAAENGVGEQVRFLGPRPRSEMPDVMKSCHVLLLTAVFPEAFARVVLEGMAAGLAVVGTLTGGTGELLEEGVTGLTVPAGDPAALARQIERLLADPELRFRLATRGQQIVCEQYSMTRMVDRIEALLHRARSEQPVRRSVIRD